MMMVNAFGRIILMKRADVFYLIGTLWIMIPMDLMTPMEPSEETDLSTRLHRSKSSFSAIDGRDFHETHHNASEVMLFAPEAIKKGSNASNNGLLVFRSRPRSKDGVVRLSAVTADNDLGIKTDSWRATSFLPPPPPSTTKHWPLPLACY